MRNNRVRGKHGTILESSASLHQKLTKFSYCTNANTLAGAKKTVNHLMTLQILMIKKIINSNKTE